MNGSSDRDPAKGDASRFEDAERAVHRADAATAEPPDGTAPGNPDESLLRTVGVAAALGTAGVIILVAIAAVVIFVGAAAGLTFGTVFIGSIVLGQYIGFIGLGTAYLRGRGLNWQGIRSYLGLRVPSLREVGVMVGGYLAIIGTLLIVVTVALRFLPEPAENEGAETFAGNPELIPAGIVVMFLVVGPSEELLFRGVVQNRIRERLSAAPAVAVAGSLFAFAHLVALLGSPPSAIAVTVAILLVPGFVLGTVYEYTGNLVVPWLLHSTHNSVLLAALLLSQSLDAPAGLLSTVIAAV